MDFYLDEEKIKVMKSTEKEIELENIILSKVTQTLTDKCHNVSLIPRA